MKKHPNRIATLAAMLVTFSIPLTLPAATALTWDADGAGSGTGGTGTWDTTSSSWRLGGTTLQTYDNTAPSPVSATFSGTAGTVTLAAGTTINVNTITGSTTGYIINGASGSKIVLSVGTGAANNPPNISSSAGTLTVNAVLDGTVGLDKGGTTTLILGGANTYTGNTTIRGGTLSVSTIGTTGGTSSNLGAGTSTINFGNGGNPGTLLYTGTGETTTRVVNLAAGAGANATIQNNGTGALNFTSNQTATGTGAKSLTFSGSNGGTMSGNVVNGSGTISVVKAGAGTWSLSGAANTYTGTTTVTAGTLLIDGVTSSSSAFSVTGGSAASAVLGGSGTINGSVGFTTATGGALSAGGTGAVGTLTTGAVTASVASNIEMELGATAASYDILKTSSLTATNFTLDLVNFGGLTFANGQTFNLFQDQSSAALALSGLFTAINLPTLSGGLSWDQSALYTTGTLVVVPEPASWSLFAIGLTALVFLRRRKLS